jgi:hypothetical protein
VTASAPAAAAPPPGTPGPPSGPAVSESCPLCGTQLPPDQDWCLRCGAAARTRLAAAPTWRGPLLAIALVAALALGALTAALIKLAADSGPPPTPSTATVTTTVTTTSSSSLLTTGTGSTAAGAVAAPGTSTSASRSLTGTTGAATSGAPGTKVTTSSNPAVVGGLKLPSVKSRKRRHSPVIVTP